MQFNLGNWSKNMLLDWSNRDAAYRQTEQEHEDTLRQYVKPGMTTEDLVNAMADGMAAEEEMSEYWLDDFPREDFNPGSSWIRQLDYYPEGNMAVMTTDRGDQYAYPMDSDMMGDWVTDRNGIGEYYNNIIKNRN